MKVAVISDIHANRHAFEATLEAVAASDAAELWCLGDLVGYGAEPDACVELAREHAAVCLAGNHDLAVTGEIPLDEFSRGASVAAEWTREVIAPENLAFLEGLEPQGEEDSIGLYHASPRDPVWEYVLSALLAELCLDAQRHRICLIGHSHVALSFVRREGELATGEPRRDGAQLDIAAGEWLLNPGSVGQPRDGDPRAVMAAARPRRDGRLLPPHRLRHRRRRRRDPRRAAAGLARRAPGVRSMTMADTSTSTSAARAAAARASLAPRPARPRGRPARRLRQLHQGPDPGRLRRPAAERLRRGPPGRRRQRRLHRHRSSVAEDRTDFTALPAASTPGLRDTLRQGIDNLRSRALALCTQPLGGDHDGSDRKTTTTATTRPAPTTTPTTTTTTTTTQRPRPRRAPSTSRGAGGGTAAPGAGRSSARRRTGRRRPASAKRAPAAGAGAGLEGGK